MKAWMELADKWARFKSGFVRDWGERMTREQDALAGLRQHPGFDALLDTYDAEVAALWEQWLHEDDPSKAEAVRQRAKATWRMIRLLEDRTRAKEVAERTQAEIQRLRGAAQANQGRREYLLEASRRGQYSSSQATGA